jgi:hypothetical protein
MSLRLLLDDPRQSVQIGQVEDLNFWFIERPAKEWREDDEKKIQALLARMTELHAKNLPICDPVYVARKPGPKRPGDDSTHWVLIGDLRVEAAWRLGEDAGIRIRVHPRTGLHAPRHRGVAERGGDAFPAARRRWRGVSPQPADALRRDRS